MAFSDMDMTKQKQKSKKTNSSLVKLECSDTDIDNVNCKMELIHRMLKNSIMQGEGDNGQCLTRKQLWCIQKLQGLNYNWKTKMVNRRLVENFNKRTNDLKMDVTRANVISGELKQYNKERKSLSQIKDTTKKLQKLTQNEDIDKHGDFYDSIGQFEDGNFFNGELDMQHEHYFSSDDYSDILNDIFKEINSDTNLQLQRLPSLSIRSADKAAETSPTLPLTTYTSSAHNYSNLSDMLDDELE